MVVSTVFESPPSSPERPSREVMLPLCWSKRAPTWVTADEQSEVFAKVTLQSYAALKGYIVAYY